MDHSTPFAHHHQYQNQATSFDSEKVDYGFDSLLGHDACLTHGLDSLGTCNNTENACLDQRCFDHYGKTAAAKNALEIGLDLKNGADKVPHRHDQANNARSTRAKSRIQSNISSSPARTVSAAAMRVSAHRQKRRRQSEQMQHNHQLDYQQPSQMHQLHSPHLIQQEQNLQHIDPTAVLQTVNESLQHNFNMPLLDNQHTSFGDFHHQNHSFSMPSFYDRWPQAVAPSWTNMMGHASVANCMPMSWTQHMGCNNATSIDCTSACGDPNCWSQCGDGDDADCCFDTSCPDTEFPHAACCFEPTCADLEPCLDASCQEAAIPCNDSHCVGTTVSTTPASVSVTTPSAEPEPIVNAILSPVEPGRGVPLDIDSTIGHDFGDFSHGIGPSFTDDLNQQAGNLASRPSASGLSHNDTFSMPSHPPTPKTELAESQSVKGQTDFTCQWLCEDGVLCSKKFGGNKELQDHCKNEHVKSLKKGENGFCCTWYGCIRPGPFSQKSKLERHMQTHTGYKPVKCEICGIMLSAKQSLEQHMRTHSGEKPWKCEHPGCEARFKQQSALTMHMRTHTGEKPLQCEICGKRFGESSNLSKHRRTHNVRGNHVCEHCGKDFHRLDQLRRHLQTHLQDGGRKSSKSS
ncbi:metalloregulatory [Fusarium beomiforme]|uniref:C2H2 type master regulator of conidiophore development brlA n=1 Tax=Fusarium beomiforme TaxID=44412 RepID=A0A9P5A6X6_9HYPO|nr:metalloregulatory [Fusarium beomiforme]